MAGNGELSRLIPENSRLPKRPSEDSKTFNVETDIESNGSGRSSASCCGDCLKSLVFGGFDGIMASLIIISAAAGASLSWRVVVVLGVASVVANSISTGVSEYLSSKAHRAFIQAEKRRELWEFKNYRDAEISEMVNRFESRGMGRRDAELVVAKMAQYESFFVGLMVSEDLGMQLAEDNDASFLTDAFLMFASYATFGAIPILLFCLGSTGLSSSRELFVLSAGSSLVVLSLLGVVKSTFSGSNWLVSALEALLVGLVCAAVSYVLGYQLIAFFMGG